MSSAPTSKGLSRRAVLTGLAAAAAAPAIAPLVSIEPHYVTGREILARQSAWAEECIRIFREINRITGVDEVFLGDDRHPTATQAELVRRQAVSRLRSIRMDRDPQA